MRLNGVWNFNDIFKKGFIQTNFTGISFVDVLICFAVALFIGMFIFLIYKRVYRGVVYSHSYNVSLVMMCLITAFVIKTISSNVVLSLGMVGALSIVRFRTALKDPMDIVFMFWAIGVGITAGAGIYPICILGSLLIGLVMAILLKQPVHDCDYLFIVHYKENATENLTKTLSHLRYKVKSKSLTNNTVEWIIQLKLEGDNTSFVNEVSAIDGVVSASLVSYNGEFAG